MEYSVLGYHSGGRHSDYGGGGGGVLAKNSVRIKSNKQYLGVIETTHIHTCSCNGNTTNFSVISVSSATSVDNAISGMSEGLAIHM